MMVKLTLKILHHLLQDFYSLFDHFGDTKRYRVKIRAWSYKIRFGAILILDVSEDGLVVCALAPTRPDCPIVCHAKHPIYGINFWS